MLLFRLSARSFITHVITTCAGISSRLLWYSNISVTFATSNQVVFLRIHRMIEAVPIAHCSEQQLQQSHLLP